MKFCFEITQLNDAHVQRRAEVTSTYADALNRELEYVQDFGLPATLLRRLVGPGIHRDARVRDEIKALVYQAALLLPVVEEVRYPPPAENQSRRSSTNFWGRNAQFLRTIQELEGVNFSSALNRALTFARLYELTADLWARLERQAERREATVRDIVTEILIARAMALPDSPPAPSAPTSAQALKVPDASASTPMSKRRPTRAHR